MISGRHVAEEEKRRDAVLEIGDGPILTANRLGKHSAVVMLGLYLVAMFATAIGSVIAGSPFVLWYEDTPKILLAVFLYMFCLGFLYDSTLVTIGMVSQIVRRVVPYGDRIPITVKSMRKIRFFTCGLYPMVMILATAVAILYTSNITLLSLKLMESVTHWKDAFFWNIEGPLLERVVSMRIDVASWDTLYHSAWLIELLAAFVLIVVDRGSHTVLKYSVSMVILFYVGRFLGLVNPVMGPALYRPEMFGYLEGSVRAKAMEAISNIIKMGPEEAVKMGGVFVDGVSAMPSLHIGMVSLTAYWISTVKK